MIAIVILFAAGVVLLALEVVVPGGILGIIGGVLMLIGVLISFEQFGFQGGALAAALALGVVGIVFYLEFVLLPKSRLARMFSMTATVAGTSQPVVADRALIGRRAVAVTALVPSGVIECEGRRFEAFSRSGHVAAGAAIDVVDLDNFRVIVTQSTNPTTSS
jgi:membrane-bound serine protease (ClpP class)